ncbi:MAG: hypothetical protein HY812_06540 [Planctomycetes bacterium]|nr:hypothetical protein [Planctomycetota bacterium]
MVTETRSAPAGEGNFSRERRPTLRRELKGLLLLYVLFAAFSCLVAFQCAGPAP